ncbi:MAG TPA: redoxin family protein [Frankiaceae bacterium]|nr:redoxin family protein [Frankiaceae bacterium]
MSRRGAVAAAVAGLLVAGSVVTALSVGAGRAARLAGRPPAEVVAPEDARPVPELTGITEWFNAPPLTMAGLRGRVVLLDVWTYSCVNCRRTFPFLRALHETYADRGLTVIGVHSPEFDFEKSPDNVERAVRDLDVTWAVANDPDRAMWDALRNSYWPAKYLVDRHGRIRLVHVGEGDEAEIEDAVRGLLADGGDPGAARAGAKHEPPRGKQTPELYLGYLRGGLVREGVTEDRADPPRRDRVRLAGRFTGAEEYVTAAAPGATVTVDYTARDVYAVLAPPAGSTARQRVEVRWNDAPVPPDRRGAAVVAREGRTYVDVRTDDLYHLLTAPAPGEGRVTLVATAPGVRFFTFTFGR